jgi:hypothetical protein
MQNKDGSANGLTEVRTKTASLILCNSLNIKGIPSIQRPGMSQEDEVAGSRSVHYQCEQCNYELGIILPLCNVWSSVAHEENKYHR